MADPEIVIEAHDLRRVYLAGEVEVQALRGVSFTIRRGELVAIVGPSGSGKSTAMNILGCLDPPSGGTYHLDGVEVSKLSKIELAGIRNSKIGFVFQGFNLLPRTSALENVELPLLYGDYPSSEQRLQLATQSLEKVMLGQRLHHLPTQLSGGEQQRVAIARALVTRPALVLADEPTGNLDTRSSMEIMKLFQELNETQQLTIIVVTHEPDIARCCRRIIAFRDGRIERDEPVLDRLRASQELLKLAAQPA